QTFVDKKDLYSMYASEFYGKPYEECYKNCDGSDTKERKTFKVVNLAIMYQMGDEALATLLNIKRKEAKELLNKFRTQYKDVDKFIKNNTKLACKYGYVTMKLDYKGTTVGRKRRLPYLKGRRWDKVVDTKSTNALIQGTSAIQTKLCMIEGNKLCKKLSGGKRQFALLLTVHDELLFKVPKDVTREE